MFNTKLAGHVISIDNKYDYIKNYYNDFLTEEESEFTVTLTDEEIAAENTEGGIWNSSYLETLAVYRRICEHLLSDDIVLFHCSSLMIDGKAVLFTAPSGTGKSTHSRLWREHFGSRVTMINDDKPLLKIGKQITVYGTPYGGKDDIKANISAPVYAVVILHQDKQNVIRKLAAIEAFPLLLNQTYYNNTIESTEKVLTLVDSISHLPVYSLGCTISDKAVSLVYDTVFDS